MSISSRIVIYWTPSNTAVTQTVQRATSLGGPWTDIVTGLGSAINTYTDETTVDNPFTTYYYRVVTVCTGGGTATSGYITVSSANCNSPGNNTIFGLWSTNGGLSTSFNYYDKTSEDYALTTAKTVTSPASKIRVVCHKCGQTIQPTGSFAQYGDVSKLSLQQHIAKYLPASPALLGTTLNDNKGNVLRKVRVNSTIIDNVAAHFGTGSGNTFTQYTLGSGTWTFKNFTQLRLGRYIFDTTTDQTTGFNSLTGTTYIAIADPSSLTRLCEVYIYQITRNTNLDVTVSTSIMRGFNITYVSTYVTNGQYVIYSFPDNVPYEWNLQPNKYFKFFNL
jgi:hypothetical protein